MLAVVVVILSLCILTWHNDIRFNKVCAVLVVLPIQENISSTGNLSSLGNRSFSPLRDFYYNLNEQNEDNRSVLVVPRRAYYNNRTVEGVPRNVLVILTEVEDSLVNGIIACEINGFHSVTIKTMKEQTDWVRNHRPGHTHCLVTVQCMGLLKEAIINGSITKIVYKKRGDAFYSRVQTEKPLFITTPHLKKGPVFTCTTLFGHPIRFEPWLRYQKTIGVDMVRLNVHASFSENATPT